MAEPNDLPSSVPIAAGSEPATEAAPAGLSRRGFLKGAGMTAAGTALLEGVQVFTRRLVPQPQKMFAR